jgi:hypothetical protein
METHGAKVFQELARDILADEERRATPLVMKAANRDEANRLLEGSRPIGSLHHAGNF